MDEFFFRAVERVGFPIAVSALSFWAVYKLFQMRENDRGGMMGKLVTEAQSQSASLTSIDKQMGVQSKTLVTTNDQICQMNAEQKKMCQADVVGKATEIAVAAALAAAVKISDVDRETELRHQEANKAQIAMNQAKLEEHRVEIEVLKAKLAEKQP